MNLRASLSAFLTSTAMITAVAVPICAPPSARDRAELTMRYDHPVHAASPTLYGLMTEEINHSYDGGRNLHIHRQLNGPESRAALQPEAYGRACEPEGPGRDRQPRLPGHARVAEHHLPRIDLYLRAKGARRGGLARNRALVVTASYAPLFVNVKPPASQWPTNLIGYGAPHSYGSPGYFAQLMFSSQLGNQGAATRLANTGPPCFASVTRNAATHTLFIKIANTAPLPQPPTLHIEGATAVARRGTLVTHSAKSTHATSSVRQVN